jgi:imidazolonepropionase-like amidohydrolase
VPRIENYFVDSLKEIMKNKLICSLLLLAGFNICLAQKASLVLHNANVYTVNLAQPVAEAIAIDGDKIVFVGKNEEVKKFITTATEVIDCKGRFVMPGLIEGHGHES